MKIRSVCLGVAAVAFVLGMPSVATAAPRFDQALDRPEGLDSVSDVSGASILRALSQDPSAYHCPNSRVWIGELDPDRAKNAYPLLPSTGGDYATLSSGQQTYAVGRGRDAGHGPTVVVFCFAHGGYAKATAVTSGFVVPPTAPVSQCLGNAKRPTIPFRCR